MIFMIYIDAKDKILGRLASSVAKMLLNGEDVYVVNVEKAVVVGKPNATKREYAEKRARGDPYHGPFFPRVADRIFRRTVRGMLPYKTPRGMAAFKRLRAFISIPDEVRGKEFMPVPGTENKGQHKSMTLEKVSDGL